jgi:hypothetical protein
MFSFSCCCCIRDAHRPSFSAIFDEASKRASPEAPHCLAIFYPGSANDAAAAGMEPSVYFHALLDIVVGICEAVAREELLHTPLKVVLEVKRRSKGFPKAHTSFTGGGSNAGASGNH